MFCIGMHVVIVVLRALSHQLQLCYDIMLLGPLLDFENIADHKSNARLTPVQCCLQVLMNPRDAQNKEITWRNSAALDGYVRRLNEVAERLAESNRQLRNWHAVLAAKVSALMDTDLVRHKDRCVLMACSKANHRCHSCIRPALCQNMEVNPDHVCCIPGRWSAGVKEMRDTFTRVEAQGYAADSQEVWRQHWDFQLYKALQYQYKQGLECINKNLPEVCCTSTQQRTLAVGVLFVVLLPKQSCVGFVFQPATSQLIAVHL